MTAAIGFGIPCVQTFVISCNNNAFTYEKLESFDKGANLLKRAVYFLLIKSKNVDFNPDEIHRELKRALSNYLDFANRNALEVDEVNKVFLDIQEQLETNQTVMK